MANLGDVLAGAAGAPVNRPALNAYVAQGQAMAGLRTAQTEDALTSAQAGQEKMAAWGELESSLQKAGVPASQAMAIRQYAQASGHDPREIIGAIQSSVVGNPGADPNARFAAAQALAPGKVNPYQNVGNQLIPEFAAGTQTPGATPPVAQTPLSESVENNNNANANLHNAEANNPQLFHPSYGSLGAGGTLPPELQTAVNEGRLDPHVLNIRNIAIYESLAKNNPTLDFNQMHTAGALAGNAPFQTRMAVMDTMPQTLQHMTDLGKALGYSDIRTVGNMQAWLNGQLNDPKYTEYMTVRNDSLMKLASVMRGVGMSDQAHQAEIEAAHPTLSPAALDGWLRGQMSVLQPLLQRYHQAMHPGGQQPTAAGAPGAPGAAGAPGAPQNDLAALAVAELQRRGVKPAAANGAQ